MGNTQSHNNPEDHSHSKPVGGAPIPQDPIAVSERLEFLTHEIANLLDGSIRCVSLAMRECQESETEPDLASVQRQLGTVYNALSQMGGILKGVVRGQGPQTIYRELQRGLEATPLGEVLEHAVDVLRPLAQDHRVTIETAFDPATHCVTTGPIYPAIVNGLRNAIESLIATPDQTEPRRVVLIATLSASSDQRQWVTIQMSDNGTGMTALNESQSIGQLFEPGVSTKSGGHGIGLAFARSLAEQLGGHIALEGGIGFQLGGRPGAVLTISVPVLAQIASQAPAGLPAQHNADEGKA